MDRIRRSGSQPSARGPADWFSGVVRIDPLFPAAAPARAAGNRGDVRAGGAHRLGIRHPLGQRPDRARRAAAASNALWRSASRRSCPGDVVWFEPGEKHSHGASPTTAMTHIAIQEALDGKAVEWLEKVADEDYLG